MRARDFDLRIAGLLNVYPPQPAPSLAPPSWRISLRGRCLACRPSWTGESFGPDLAGGAILAARTRHRVGGCLVRIRARVPWQCPADWGLAANFAARLRGQDSNLELRIQSPTCYRYTTPHRFSL